MATKNIEAVLKWVGQGDAPPELAPALEELAAIHLLAKRLDDAGFIGQLRSERRNQSADLLESIAREAS